MNEFTNLLESTSKVNENDNYFSPEIVKCKKVSNKKYNLTCPLCSKEFAEFLQKSEASYKTKCPGCGKSLMIRPEEIVKACDTNFKAQESIMKIKEGSQDKVDSILDKLDIPVEEFDEAFDSLLNRPFTQANVSKALESLQKIKVILDELKSVKEGRIPDYRKDKEETVIKKLTEEEDKQDYVIVGPFDYKEVPDLIEALEKACHQLKITMHPLSITVGSDSYGYIVSNRLLSSGELKTIEKENRLGK